MGNFAPDEKLYTPEEQADLSVALVLLTLGVQKSPAPLLTLPLLLEWHQRFGQKVPRLEPGKLRSQLGMRAGFGRYRATPPEQVPEELRNLFADLQRIVVSIDEHLETNPDASASMTLVEHVVRSSAWLHAHLVRIHPFADGNGRLSRLAQTWLLARYNLPAPSFDDPEEYLTAINRFHDTAPRHDVTALHELSLKKILEAQRKVSKELAVRRRHIP